MKTKPIVALDFSTSSEIKQFLNEFKDESLFVKIGMELYYQNGPEIVRYIKSLGHEIFLDLKLHDIPNTVKRSMQGLAALDIDMINVHAAGGKEMMQAAMEGIIAGTPAGKERPKLIAVTQLTSTTQEAMQTEQLITVPLLKSVVHYAKLTQAAGLDGVVCSALEARLIKEQTFANFLCVTPGIRLETDEHGDQKRMSTPDFARKNRASFIVVGRPITLAKNPVAAYHSIKNQWNGVEN
ncbi:orotidine-5'-phosphate decarboxylase [Carnobacterium iners]|uniref:Orotidine 5'-phosphate decarboxylase n=1 Tax=Carnobacterium iners TaxID=1073423 RepID=A0A1X7NGS8_9LACT|nr:orotidine-5'-phosphate decarboxylase [Carnobacterium iners]SEK38985.1 orotidine-5'-phosphate decarboxylase [Carnobacterium iners]SMH36324.1 orotidine-5'-phosphate decarboxylase [Carnobacterium iners]